MKNGFIKNIFSMFLIKKNGCNSTFDFSDRLTPVQLNYSLFRFSQPETNTITFEQIFHFHNFH